MKKSISGNGSAACTNHNYSLRGLKIATTSLLVLGALSSCIGDDPEVVSDVEENFTGIKSISVEGAFLDVSYEGTSSGEVVHLDALLKANTNSRAKINYEVKGDKLIIEVKSLGGSNRKSEGFIQLVGPENITLDLGVSSGSLQVEKVKNNSTTLRASSGTIQAKDLNSLNIIFSTSSGELVGEDLTGKVTAAYSSGQVYFSRITGNLKSEGSSGNIIVQSLSGKIDAKASSGKIDIENVNELGKLLVSSGSIVGRQAGLGPGTELTASSGNISIQTNSVLAQFNYDLAASSGSVKVGDSQSPGVLKINNGAAHTVKGLVGSGKIQIVN
jgi:lia operon protein LiaG